MQKDVDGSGQASTNYNTDNRLPTTRHQQKPSIATPNNLQSPSQHPTTNKNNQLPPTDPTDNHHQLNTQQPTDDTKTADQLGSKNPSPGPPFYNPPPNRSSKNVL
jgi:hypothetical protein